MISLRARSARSWPAAAVLAFLAACGGGAERRSAVPLSKTDHVEVTYVDGSNKLTLRSMSTVDEATYRERGLYGDAGAPDVKLADHDSLQALIDALHELGHFDRAAQDLRPGAKVALRVRQNDKVSVWSQPQLQPDNMAELERFNTARLAFLQIHNNIISYHASKMSKADFERELVEQNAKNRAAVQNIMDKARGKGQ
jgi:hypothetical protein